MTGDIAELCDNDGTLYHTAQSAGVIRTLHDSLITQGQARQYTTPNICFLTLSDIKYGSWIFLNLTSLDVVNGNAEQPAVKVSNERGTIIEHLITKDNAVGTTMVFMVDKSYEYAGKYVLRFRLTFGQRNRNQAIQIVMTYLSK